MLIKLPMGRFINLERVNMIDFDAISETACITWATGDAPLYIKGQDAIAFITAVEQCDVVDALHFLSAARDIVDTFGGVDDEF